MAGERRTTRATRTPGTSATARKAPLRARVAPAPVTPALASVDDGVASAIAMPTAHAGTAPAVAAATHRPSTRWIRQGCKLTEAEYGSLSTLKKRAAQLARPMKRSELMRVALHALAQLDDVALFDVLDRTELVRR